MLTLLHRLVRDDEGQDLIEYALLAVLVGIVGVLIFPEIRTKMGTAFGNWGTSVNDLWVPNDPL
jgi:Flp pilus assembly pilin Flp